MRIRSLLLTATLAAPALVASAATVSAQEYGGTGGTTTDRGGESTEVLGETQERPSVGGTDLVRSAPQSSNTLPVTGGDLVGLAVIGVSLVGGGVVLVRRTRQQPATV